MFAVRGLLSSLVHGGRVPRTSFCMLRSLSTSTTSSTGDVKLDIDRTSGIAQVTLSKKRVNTMSLEFMTEICDTMDKVEADTDCRALIITSCIPHAFCAGLELTEVQRPDMARFKPFWRTLQDVWIKIYTSRLATVAAISGHALAGGCLLTLACDHRIMVDEKKYLIGLNETRVGLGVPFWLCAGMADVIGKRRSDESVLMGLLYSPQEALNIGLVDELCPSDQLMDRANQKVQKWLAVPDGPRQLTKSSVHADAVKAFWAGREQDVEDFAVLVSTEATQNILTDVLANLGGKKK